MSRRRARIASFLLNTYHVRGITHPVTGEWLYLERGRALRAAYTRKKRGWR